MVNCQNIKKNDWRLNKNAFDTRYSERRGLIEDPIAQQNGKASRLRRCCMYAALPRKCHPGVCNKPVYTIKLYEILYSGGSRWVRAPHPFRPTNLHIMIIITKHYVSHLALSNQGFGDYQRKFDLEIWVIKFALARCYTPLLTSPTPLYSWE